MACHVQTSDKYWMNKDGITELQEKHIWKQALKNAIANGETRMSMSHFQNYIDMVDPKPIQAKYPTPDKATDRPTRKLLAKVMLAHISPRDRHVAGNFIQRYAEYSHLTIEDVVKLPIFTRLNASGIIDGKRLTKR
jgi:hypothetical protein